MKPTSPAANAESATKDLQLMTKRFSLGIDLGTTNCAIAAPVPYYAPTDAPAPTYGPWWWCDATQSYYPYAQTCPSGFRAVQPR